MTLLQRAAERRPPFPPAFYELGKLLRLQHRFAEAEAVLKRGMEAVPGVAEFPLALGRVLLERGDMEGAKGAFAKALAIAPGHTAALQGLVYSLKDIGDFHGRWNGRERLSHVIPQIKTALAVGHLPA